MVTGGASGQGRAIALALAARGAAVAIGSHVTPPDEGVDTHVPGREGLAAVAAEIAALGVPAFADALDVRETASVERFVAAAEAALGPIDILVCAAGISAMAGIEGHPEALWHDVIDVNLNGVFRCVRACLPGMRRRGWGRIIVIASTAASLGAAQHAAYCASKHGVLGLMRVAALEGAAEGVTCNAISPGHVRTPMLEAAARRAIALEGSGESVAERLARIAAGLPQRRLIEPEEIAAVAAFLASDAAASVSMEDITVAGASLW